MLEFFFLENFCRVGWPLWNKSKDPNHFFDLVFGEFGSAIQNGYFLHVRMMFPKMAHIKNRFIDRLKRDLQMMVQMKCPAHSPKIAIIGLFGAVVFFLDAMFCIKSWRIFQIILILRKQDTRYMEAKYNAEERELVKLVAFFRKHAEELSSEENYPHMMETCDRLLEQLDIHVRSREAVLAARDQLNSLVQDNAYCPRCEKNANLKMVGIDISVQGWKNNKYRCRACNIEFVWNVPNNPWDMVPYVQEFILELEKRLMDAGQDEATRRMNTEALAQMKENLSKIKPIVEASQANMAELEAREQEMSDMVNKVKKHLLIEKIRLDL